ARLVERYRDTGGRADRGTYHREGAAGRADVAHEGRERAEVAVGSRQLVGRQQVAATGLENAELGQIAAHRRLRDRESLAPEQLRELALPPHYAGAQDAHDGVTPLELAVLGQHAMQKSVCINSHNCA